MANMFKSPKMPAIEPPTPMPDEKQTIDARRRRVVSEVVGKGAASTILSAGGRETLGA